MITVAKVANASQTELLCITYELFLEHLEKAIQAKEEQRNKELEWSRKILLSLIENLNFEVPLAGELFKIYIYIQNILINEKKQDTKLQEAYRLMDKIYKAYLEVDKQLGKTKPVMENVENIYAGLTYGKGQLNEITLQDSNRGYKA